MRNLTSCTVISKTGEIVDLGVQYEVVKKSGAWYAYDDAKIAQGREAAKNFFRDNPEVALEVEQKIIAKVKGISLEEVQGKTKETTETAKA